MGRVGRVKLAEKTVGVIEEHDGWTRFTYSAEWLAQPDAVTPKSHLR